MQLAKQLEIHEGYDKTKEKLNKAIKHLKKDRTPRSGKITTEMINTRDLKKLYQARRSTKPSRKHSKSQMTGK